MKLLGDCKLIFQKKEKRKNDSFIIDLNWLPPNALEPVTHSAFSSSSLLFSSALTSAAMATSFSNAMPPSAFLKPRSPSPRSPLLTSRSAKPFQSSTRFASLLPAIVCKAISTKPHAEIEGLNIAEDVTQVLEFGLYGVTWALLLLNFQLICLIEFSAKFFMRTE